MRIVRADPEKAEPSATKDIDRVVSIDGDRGLYLRCTGTGSPTLILEGGDDDTTDSYAFARDRLDDATRTCAYDRANLGRSDPAPAPRGTKEYLSDLEKLLAAADIPGPYLLVGTSGGGYISAGFAYAHPEDVAGIVFVEVPAPFRNPRRRSSRPRSPTLRTTSRSATTSRWRRTRGTSGRRSATSR